jgi:hypothetical protein
MRPFLIALAMLPLLARAAECTTRSGPHLNAVVELYTSEGCSSCPPADRWLSGLGASAASGGVIPLAFHVSYWDYIGWKDPFASERATERQRAIASAAGARYVYTPQVVIGGRDLPSWRSSGSGAIEAIRRKPAKATIELAIRTDASNAIEVTSTTALAEGVGKKDVVVLVAATENGLASRVTAGENRGERLAHDFVVRDFTVFKGVGRSEATFRAAQKWNPAQMSVVAFVQDPRTGEILQALAASCRG